MKNLQLTYLMILKINHFVPKTEAKAIISTFIHHYTFVQCNKKKVKSGNKSIKSLFCSNMTLHVKYCKELQKAIRIR